MTKGEALKMNKRISELAESCMIEEYNQHGNLIESGFDYEKFAELIVRDCACVPTDMWGEGQLPADQASRVQRRILAHFGVKE